MNRNKLMNRNKPHRMAKIKTRKAVVTFKDQVLSILVAHNIIVPAAEETALLNDFLEYFNNTYTPEKKVLPFSKEITTQYFEVYEEVNKVKPSYLGGEPKALKEIGFTLIDRHKIKFPKVEWTKEVALQKHLDLYRLVLTLDVVRKNFSASYLYYNFDKIVSWLRYGAENEEAIRRKLLED